MTTIQAKTVHNLISQKNRVKAVEISGFVAMLKAEDKCNEDLVNDVDEYVGMLGLLYNTFQKSSVNQITRRKNPIDKKDFARLTKYHIELNAFIDLVKQQIK